MGPHRRMQQIHRRDRAMETGKGRGQKDRLATVMYNLAESLRIVGIFRQPYLPNTAPKLFEQLGVSGETHRLPKPAGSASCPAGTRVHRREALFPRIDVKKELEELEIGERSLPRRRSCSASAAPAPKAEEAKDEEPQELIDFDTFLQGKDEDRQGHRLQVHREEQEASAVHAGLRRSPAHHTFRHSQVVFRA